MAKMKMRRMMIEPAENGGHMVTHEMAPQMSHSGKMGVGMAYKEPEKHVFGKEEGHEMLAHIANHLAIKEPEEGETEEEADGE